MKLFSISFFVMSFLAHAIDDLIFDFNPAQALDTSIEQEGFTAGTEVATQAGLIPIEKCRAGDIIFSYDLQGHVIEHVITDFFCQKVEQYVQITTDHIALQAAIHQKFYLPQERTWVVAERLKIGDKLFGFDQKLFTIIDLQHVQFPTTIYQLSTTQGSFFVSSAGILVHNMQSVSQIAVGCLNTMNPVAHMIGATLSLQAGAKALYQSYNKPEPLSFENQDGHFDKKSREDFLVDELYLLEKPYYEQRKYVLCQLRNDLRSTQSGIEVAIELLRKAKNSIIFTHDFFHNAKTNHVLLSAEKSVDDDDSILSLEQRIFFNKKRESELLQLENEIIELQTLLVFHFNELIQRVREATQTCNACAGQMKKKSLMPHQKLQIAHKVLRLIEIIENRMLELKTVVAYYQDAQKAEVIKKTTTIMQLINDVEKMIPQKDRALKELKKTTLSVKQTYENSLRQDGRDAALVQKEILLKINKELQEAELKESSLAQRRYRQTARHNPTLVLSSRTYCPIP